MSYCIKKIVGTQTKRHLNGLRNYEEAHDTLECIYNAERRNKNKAELGIWQLKINDNQVIYEIVEDSPLIPFDAG